MTTLLKNLSHQAEFPFKVPPKDTMYPPSKITFGFTIAHCNNILKVNKAIIDVI